MPLPSIPRVFDLPTQLVEHMRQATATAEASPANGFRLDLAQYSVPASFIRWLVLDAAPALENHVSRLEIWRAQVADAIQFAGTALRVTPSFGACQLGDIDLTDASAAGFEIIGGDIGCLRADRLVATGSLLCRGVRNDPDFQFDPPTDASDTVEVTQGVLLSGAKIHGNLDLRGGRLGFVPNVQGDAHIALLADGLELDGNALLCEGFRAEGEIRLNGSRIKRNLDCTGARLRNLHGFSLSAAGAQVDGSIYLRRQEADGRRFKSRGTLRLDGARIGGDLDAAGGKFTATAFHEPNWDLVQPPAGDNSDELDAILATGLDVGASVSFCDGAVIRGRASLVLAQIGGDLHCSDASFDFPGEVAFCADGATVSGCTFLDDARTNGLLRFVQAKLQQGCVAKHLVLDLTGQNQQWAIGDAVKQELGPDVCGVYAAGAIIGGSFIWQDVQVEEAPQPALVPGGVDQRTAWLSAQGATVEEVSDDRRSWEVLRRIDLRDCTYARIDRLSADAGWRLALLDREYAPWNQRYGDLRLNWDVLVRTWRGEAQLDKAGSLGEQVHLFVPNPYTQLARALTNSGFERSANDVLLQLERNRTRYGGLRLPGLLWRFMLACALQYGQSPFRPAYYLAAWALISGVLFNRVHEAHGMVKVGEDVNVTFNWLFYALDTLVPFVDFGQKKNFAIEPLFSGGGVLLLLNSILGYAAVGFLAAGLSGLVRTGRDG